MYYYYVQLGQMLEESNMFFKPEITAIVGNAQVLCFGTPSDWATRAILQEGDQSKSPHLVHLLGEIAEKYGVTNFYCPTIQFTRKFVRDFEHFPYKLSLSYRVAKMHCGTVAEGRELHHGEAFVVAPADCSTIVASYAHGLYVCHAGLKSLLDFHKLGAAGIIHSSIVDELYKKIPREVRRFAQVGIFLPISAGGHYQHRFDDPVYGERNELLVKYLTRSFGDACVVGDPSLGQIDLRAVICRQLELAGIVSQNIAPTILNSCPFLAKNLDGSSTWHSHRRNGDGSRNLVVVINE